MENQFKQGAVCFLVRNDETLLVLVENSPTNRKWNGIGGMIETGESPEEAVIREIGEETYLKVDKSSLKKAATIRTLSTLETFELHVFLADKWAGQLRIKDQSLKEFRWFPKANLPYDQMFPGNDQWLPKVLAGKLVRSTNGNLDEVTAFN